MKQFNIFEHPSKGLDAVKVGFSWPAFFLGIIWLVFKGMWKYAGIFFVIYLIMTFIQNSISSSDLEPGLEATYVLMVRITHLFILIILGFKGNFWRESTLREKGYIFITTVHADSPARALEKFRAEDTRQPDS